MNKNKNEDIQQFFTPKIAVLGLVKGDKRNVY